MSDISNLISGAQRAMGEVLFKISAQVDHIARMVDTDRERLVRAETLINQVARQPRINREPGSTPLEILLAELVQGQRDNANRLTQLSQQRTQERLTSGEYIAHQEIARQYRDLIGQELLDAVVGEPDRGLRMEATRRNWLAFALFSSDYKPSGRRAAHKILRQDGLNISDTRFAEIWKIGEEIRAAADRTGHRYDWSFDHDKGQPVDPAKQDVYDGCDPDGLISFVVAPAYIVDGDKTYVKQLVFTEPLPPQHETQRTTATEVGANAQKTSSQQAEGGGEPPVSGTGQTGQPSTAEATAAAAVTDSHPAADSDQKPMISAPNTAHDEPDPATQAPENSASDAGGTGWPGQRPPDRQAPAPGQTPPPGHGSAGDRPPGTSNQPPGAGYRPPQPRGWSGHR